MPPIMHPVVVVLVDNDDEGIGWLGMVGPTAWMGVVYW